MVNRKKKRKIFIVLAAPLRQGARATTMFVCLSVRRSHAQKSKINWEMSVEFYL